MNDKTRQAHSNNMKNKWKDPIWRERAIKRMKKNHVGMAGKKHSLEVIEKMRIAKLGSKNPMHGVKGKNNPLFGVKRSPEVVEKTKVTQFKNGIFPWNKGKKTGLTPWNYKYKHSSEEKRARDSFLYQTWRFSVFSRDNFMCKKCNKKNPGKLNAHHIDNFINNIDKRYDIDNGITLCNDCHNHFHRKYGFRKNTKDQVKDYIKNINI